MERGRNIALVLAGGHGARMHTETPKQFLTLQGIPVILHTLRAFERHPLVDDIAVVCVEGWENFLCETIKEDGLRKVRYVFKGGAESHTSIHNGIGCLSHIYNPDTDIVLVHEAVRPLISFKIISDCIRVCRAKGNAITAVRDNEAVMYSDDGVSSAQCFPREKMFRAQTPHTFFLGDLEKAYEEAGRLNLCSQSLYTLMAELNRGPFHIVEGDRYNMKLTYPEDFKIAEVMADMLVTG